MARLRHFAVCVKDLDKAAEFYSNVFEFKRIGREDLEIGSAIYMSDGVINLALLNFTGAAGSKASDLKEGADLRRRASFRHPGRRPRRAQKRIEATGGKFFFDLGDERHGNFERKFKDPDGVIFEFRRTAGRARTATRNNADAATGLPHAQAAPASILRKCDVLERHDARWPRHRSAPLFDEVVGVELVDRRRLLDEALGQVEVLQLGEPVGVRPRPAPSARDRPAWRTC